MDLSAGPGHGAKDRCTAYAAHAVQQYRLFLIDPPGLHAAAIGAVEVRSAQTLPGAK